jgi:hypothetical protein
MACNGCENTFQGYQSVVVSIEKSGATARLIVENHGRNIVMIRRILLCYTGPAGTGVLYLRPPPDQISWIPHTAFLEQGTGGLFYTLSVSSGFNLVQAQAEYVEIDGRSRSCPTAF